MRSLPTASDLGDQQINLAPRLVHVTGPQRDRHAGVRQGIDMANGCPLFLRGRHCLARRGRWPDPGSRQPQNAGQLRPHRHRRFDLVTNPQRGVEVVRLAQCAFGEFPRHRLVTQTMVGQPEDAVSEMDGAEVARAFGGGRVSARDASAAG